jgi:fused signal recognition particle receptor
MADVFSRWKAGLSKTSKVAFGRLAGLFGVTEITDDTWDDLEALLIQADVGVETTHAIIASLKDSVRSQGLTQAADLMDLLRVELRSRLDSPSRFNLTTRPTVVLLVGVNGSGKTTTAAKLGQRFTSQGRSVLFGAADTFRAAAVDQLQVWGDRLDIPVVSGQPESDPGAVAYNTVQAGISRQTDLILIDTAGRLHTRYNLMEELKKIYRVVGKTMSGAPHAVWLVLDATTGQNALQQAKAFKDAVSVTGVILAKLDSSGRGGMAFAIQRELGLPILYAGLGEKPDDLQPFDPDAFIEGILSVS